MTISGGSAGGFPAARHYPAAALVQLSIWPHLKYRAHYGTANLGAFFNKHRGTILVAVPTAANAAEGVSGLGLSVGKGWLEGNTGNTAPR